MSNLPRQDYDPPRAEICLTVCPRCGAGGKDAPEYFLDGNGKEISWEEIEKAIDVAVKARR